LVGNLESRVRRGKGQFGRGAVVHFERGNQADRFVADAVVSERDALSEARPVEVIGRRQKSHGAIPETPP